MPAIWAQLLPLVSTAASIIRLSWDVGTQHPLHRADRRGATRTVEPSIAHLRARGVGHVQHFRLIPDLAGEGSAGSSSQLPLHGEPAMPHLRGSKSREKKIEKRKASIFATAILKRVGDTKKQVEAKLQLAAAPNFEDAPNPPEALTMMMMMISGYSTLQLQIRGSI